MSMNLDLKMWIKFKNMINPKTPLVNVQRLKTAATYSRETETDEAKTTLNLLPQQIAPNSNYTGPKLKLKPGKYPSKLQTCDHKQ